MNFPALLLKTKRDISFDNEGFFLPFLCIHDTMLCMYVYNDLLTLRRAFVLIISSIFVTSHLITDVNMIFVLT